MSNGVLSGLDVAEVFFYVDRRELDSRAFRLLPVGMTLLFFGEYCPRCQQWH